MQELKSEYDIVIVGAGIAGLAAAATAVELGATAAVLEKQSCIGGTTAMSGGWFAFSETPDQQAKGIEDSDEAFVADMFEASGHEADMTLLRALAQDQHETYGWLADLGVTYDVVKISSGQSVARSHHVNVERVMDALLERAQSTGGVDIVCGAAARRLLTDSDGKVVGVHFSGESAQNDSNQDIPCSALDVRSRGGVLLATGGFSRSPELLEQFAPGQGRAVPYGGLGSTGDGLRLGLKLGAGLKDTEYVAGTYGSHPETTLAEHELLTAFYMGAIIVDPTGRRFVDESLSYKTLGSAVLNHTDGGVAYQVFDAQVRAKSQPGIPLSDIDHLEDKGRLLKADTWDGLADQAGMPPGSLSETVATYNEAAAGRRVDTLGRTGLVNGVGDLLGLVQPPFYAYPAMTLMTSTYGGLQVDPHARVLREDATVIPGLYAAGELAGGFHGQAYVTGTALSKGAIYGRIAAREMAARVER